MSSRALARLRLATMSGRLEPEDALVSLLEGPALQGHQAPNADTSNRQHLVEPLARERRALGGTLHLDERACTGHDDSHVNFDGSVFGEVQVKHSLAIHY